ncbi:hypothetical protein D3C87_1556350 [compost metagenome]
MKEATTCFFRLAIAASSVPAANAAPSLDAFVFSQFSPLKVAESAIDVSCFWSWPISFWIFFLSAVGSWARISLSLIS